MPDPERTATSICDDAPQKQTVLTPAKLHSTYAAFTNPAQKTDATARRRAQADTKDQLSATSSIRTVLNPLTATASVSTTATRRLSNLSLKTRLYSHARIAKLRLFLRRSAGKAVSPLASTDPSHPSLDSWKALIQQDSMRSAVAAEAADTAISRTMGEHEIGVTNDRQHRVRTIYMSTRHSGDRHRERSDLLLKLFLLSYAAAGKRMDGYCSITFPDIQ
ncbi:MAG: hypothetical protein Q9198_007038, partial [Flavoplaca austrocitrina]